MWLIARQSGHAVQGVSSWPAPPLADFRAAQDSAEGHAQALHRLLHHSGQPVVHAMNHQHLIHDGHPDGRGGENRIQGLPLLLLAFQRGAQRLFHRRTLGEVIQESEHGLGALKTKMGTGDFEINGLTLLRSATAFRGEGDAVRGVVHFGLHAIHIRSDEIIETPLEEHFMRVAQQCRGRRIRCQDVVRRGVENDDRLRRMFKDA